jgi:hypothetical protein
MEAGRTDGSRDAGTSGHAGDASGTPEASGGQPSSSPDATPDVAEAEDAGRTPGDALSDASNDACGDATCSGKPPEPPGLEGFTQSHNDFRTGRGLELLAWDPALAPSAQAEADSCRSDLPPVTTGYSRNYVAFNGFHGSPDQAVGFWIDGQETYSEDSGTCADLKCLMYVHLIAPAVERVGCAVAECDQLAPSGIAGPFTVWVCHYAP